MSNQSDDFSRAASDKPKYRAAHVRDSARLYGEESQSYSSGSTEAFSGAVVRDNLVRVKKKRKSPKKGLKIALCIVAALLLILGGIGVAVAMYYNDLASRIVYQGDTEALDVVLTEAKEQEPFYVLLIGSDKWQDNGARSDMMLLARVDIETATVTMVSVPRDTSYQLHGDTIKLNRVYELEGEAACIAAVSEVTGVPISHYAEVEFDQLQSVVDALGGILVDVPIAIDYTVYTGDQDTVHIDAGKQVINGEQAVALARMRTDYDSITSTDDAIRQANIRMMMVAMIKQVLDAPLSEIPGHIQSLAAMVKTDIPMDTLVDWAMKLAQAPKVTLYTCTGPTLGGIDEATQSWLTYEAPEAWAALMAVVDAGEDPAGVLIADDSGGIKLQQTEVIENSSEQSAGNTG